jgi:hypothetical protein
MNSISGSLEKPEFLTYKRWILLRVVLWISDEGVATDEEAWWLKRGWEPAGWKLDE